MDVNELFRFEKNEDGYTIAEYLKKNDPQITELEIPEEYNSFPVTTIGFCSFINSDYIKRVVLPPSVRSIHIKAFYCCLSLEEVEFSEELEVILSDTFAYTVLKSANLPKSLKELGERAFAHCHNLESVTFNSAPSFGRNVFFNCFKLPADVTLMGLVNSCNLNRSFDTYTFNDAFNPATPWRDGYFKYTRPDVFELAVKNDCFRSVDISVMLRFLIKTGDAESLRLTEKHGMLDDAALLSALTEYSAGQGKTELTAYLLDLKNRKFGFTAGGDLDL